MDSLAHLNLLLAQTVPAEVVAGPKSTLEIIKDSDPLLQLTLAVLVFFSVVSWGIILYKWRFLNQAHQETGKFLEAFWSADRLDEAYKTVENYPHSPVAQVFRAGFAELRRLLQDSGEDKDKKESEGKSSSNIGPSGIDNVTRALRRAGTAQITTLERRLPFLATCGSTAPFIGLFGTVWGILQAFQKIGATGNASIQTVGPSISEALIATAVGLFAAIPAVMAYNFFLSRIRVLSAEMDNFSADFLNIVKRHFFRG
ncbi:MAG: protein TolQ [Myxococcota bacterium]